MPASTLSLRNSWKKRWNPEKLSFNSQFSILPKSNQIQIPPGNSKEKLDSLLHEFITIIRIKIKNNLSEYAWLREEEELNNLPREPLLIFVVSMPDWLDWWRSIYKISFHPPMIATCTADTDSFFFFVGFV